ncbi:hypothetical protein ACOME3_008904 [Neoechinorhynchus agilis]
MFTGDVNARFTNVPLTKTINLSANLLSKNCSEPRLDLGTFHSLIQWCMNMTAFEFEAPTLANIYIRDWESTFLVLHSHVNRWWRYVAYVFILTDSNNNRDSLNAELNSQNPHMQWTVNEESINGEASFMDVLIKRSAQGKVRSFTLSQGGPTMGTTTTLVKSQTDEV